MDFFLLDTSKIPLQMLLSECKEGRNINSEEIVKMFIEPITVPRDYIIEIYSIMLAMIIIQNLFTTVKIIRC